MQENEEFSPEECEEKVIQCRATAEELYKDFKKLKEAADPKEAQNPTLSGDKTNKI